MSDQKKQYEIRDISMVCTTAKEFIKASRRLDRFCEALVTMGAVETDKALLVEVGIHRRIIDLFEIIIEKTERDAEARAIAHTNES